MPPQRERDPEPLLDTFGSELRFRRDAAGLSRNKLAEALGCTGQWIVMDEAVLHRPIGGPKLMYAQLQHLVEAALYPKITVQVVASRRGSYAGLEGSFTILSFHDEPDVAYVENSGTGWTIREQGAVAAYDVRFDLIRSAAKSDDESLDLITAVMEKYA